MQAEEEICSLSAGKLRSLRNTLRHLYRPWLLSGVVNQQARLGHRDLSLSLLERLLHSSEYSRSIYQTWIHTSFPLFAVDEESFSFTPRAPRCGQSEQPGASLRWTERLGQALTGILRSSLQAQASGEPVGACAQSLDDRSRGCHECQHRCNESMNISDARYMAPTSSNSSRTCK